MIIICGKEDDSCHMFIFMSNLAERKRNESWRMTMNYLLFNQVETAFAVV